MNGTSRAPGGCALWLQPTTGAVLSALPRCVACVAGDGEEVPAGADSSCRPDTFEDGHASVSARATATDGPWRRRAIEPSPDRSRREVETNSWKRSLSGLTEVSNRQTVAKLFSRAVQHYAEVRLSQL